jgi:hypothetical protein
MPLVRRKEGRGKGRKGEEGRKERSGGSYALLVSFGEMRQEGNKVRYFNLFCFVLIYFIFFNPV